MQQLATCVRNVPSGIKCTGHNIIVQYCTKVLGMQWTMLTLAHARRVIVCLSVCLSVCVCVCPRFFSVALAAMIVKCGCCSNHCLPSVQQESGAEKARYADGTAVFQLQLSVH